MAAYTRHGNVRVAFLVRAVSAAPQYHMHTRSSFARCSGCTHSESMFTMMRKRRPFAGPLHRMEQGLVRFGQWVVELRGRL